MLAILFFLILILTFLFLHVRGTDWRVSLTKALMLWTAGIVLLTEVFSLLELLYFPWLATSYVAVTIILFTVLWWKKKAYFSFSSYSHWSQTIKKWKGAFSLPHESKFFYYALFTNLIIVITFITAIVSPPNNNDAMIYHMPRVMHWIAHHRVDHYATHTDLQLMFGPLAEYMILHVSMLAQSDRLVNLIQWLFFVGSIITASLVVKELGGNKKIQFLSSVFVTTLPMAILQASTTQNDLVVSFFVLALSYFILASIKTGHQSSTLVFYLGLSIALLLFTKGTGYIFAAPLMIWYAIQLLATKNTRVIIKNITLLAALVILINISHAGRNYEIYGWPLGNREILRAVSVEGISARNVASNIIKNSVSQLASPLPQFNSFLEKILIPATHRIIGIDASDPRTTLAPTFSIFLQMGVNEDFAGNFFHFIIILLLTVYFFVGYKTYSRNIRGYVLAVLGGFVLFSALLKWQLWINRLDLPFLVMGSVLIVILQSRTKRLQYHLLLFDLLFLAALFPLFFNDARPIIGAVPYANHENNQSILTTPRERQYFANRAEILQSYTTVVEKLQEDQCQRVGLIAVGNEYQLWTLTAMRNLNVKFQDVMVTGPSKTKERRFDGICAIITSPKANNNSTTINYYNQLFQKMWGDDIIWYYREESES